VVPAVLLRGGGTLFLVDPPAALPVGPDPGVGRPPGPTVLGRLNELLTGGTAPKELLASDDDLLEAIAAAGWPARTATPGVVRRAREALPWPPFRSVRADYLRRARERLAEQLSTPEETLIALAREEERVERAGRRERSASEHWVAPAAGPLAEYAGEWAVHREAIERHHRALLDRLENAARRTVPNLAAVVGPRTAGRLVAAAGGLSALARMPSSRIQLLGTRRRPAGDRGPRYGLIAPTIHESDLPPSRWGAYARSLAAIAAIAARADATTRSSIAGPLVARRDRRARALRAGAGR
jgi:hypothetical protein